MPVNLLGGSGRSRGTTATSKCLKCGYALLPSQSRCPECGFAAAPSKARGRHRVVQLYQRGPEAVWPIAIRFSAMGAVAAAGPFIIITGMVLALTLGVGPGVGLDTALCILMSSLPIVVALSVPVGWGSIGGEESPVQVERPRILGIAIHKLALALSPAWWILAGLVAFGALNPLTAVVAILSMIAAAASAYLHLCWLSELGLAVADDGPHRVLNICVGLAIVSAFIALVAALFATTWAIPLLALSFVVFSVVLGEIVASLQMARDMTSTLIASYEELGREQRRAERAAEYETRLPP